MRQRRQDNELEREQPRHDSAMPISDVMSEGQQSDGQQFNSRQLHTIADTAIGDQVSFLEGPDDAGTIMWRVGRMAGIRAADGTTFAVYHPDPSDSRARLVMARMG